MHYCLLPQHAARAHCIARLCVLVVFALVASLLMGCVAPATNATTAGIEDSTALHTVYVVSHGWHTGIVVRSRDIPTGIWPESGDFPQAHYLEVGWGDRDFYMAPGFDLGLALKALLWPTPSVLHVVGFQGSVVANFPASEIVQLKLEPAPLESLLRFIDASHARRGQEAAPALGRGLYGDGRFYPAQGAFHLFRTCNVWMARALQAAGLPLRAFLALTTGSVMQQVRAIGRPLRPPAGATSTNENEQAGGLQAWTFDRTLTGATATNANGQAGDRCAVPCRAPDSASMRAQAGWESTRRRPASSRASPVAAASSSTPGYHCTLPQSGPPISVSSVPLPSPT
jgi:uncharacterized protein (TIGR02117 family)